MKRLIIILFFLFPLLLSGQIIPEPTPEDLKSGKMVVWLGSKNNITFIKDSVSIFITGKLKNGRKNGIFKFYNFKGYLLYEGKFKNDEQTGMWKYYNQDGSLNDIQSFPIKNSQKLWITNHSEILKLMGKNEYQNAQQLALENFEFSLKKLGRKSNQYFLSLLALAQIDHHLGNPERAAKKYEEILEKTEKIYGSKFSTYRLSLMGYAWALKDLGLKEASLKNYQKLIEIIEGAKGKEDGEYEMALKEFAIAARDLGADVEALETFSELRQINYLKNYINYAFYLTEQASLLEKNGQYEETIPLYNEGLQFIIKEFGEGSSEEGFGLFRLADANFKAGFYNISDSLYQNAATVFKNQEGELGESYNIVLNSLGLVKNRLGNSLEALDLYFKSLNILKKHPNVDSLNMGNVLSNIGSAYKDIGNYQEAHTYFQEALIYINNKKARDKVLNNLAGVYVDSGNYPEALKLYLNLADSFKGSGDYDVYINNLGSLYILLGQYNKALSLYLEIYDELNDDRKIADLSGNLARVYQKLGNYEEALNFYLKSKEKTEKLYGKNHENYAILLNNLGLLYMSDNEYEKAYELIKESLEITESNYGKSHPKYVTSLHNLAYFYTQTKQYDKALDLFKTARNITREIFGSNHPENLTTTLNLVGLYHETSRNIEAFEEFNNYFSLLKKEIDRNFPVFTENEKLQYLDNKEFDIYELKSFLLDYSSVNPEAAVLAYDLELTLKNLTLHSAAQVRHLIENSSDLDLINVYERYHGIEKEINNEYSKPFENRTERLEQLEDEADRLERELNRHLKIKKTNLKWLDIQKALEDDQVAVEFSKFEYHNGSEWTGETYYVAIIIRKDDPYPTLIKLCEEKELEDALKSKEFEDLFRINTIYSTQNKLYDLIWKPIEKYLSQKVVFAPSGLLHQISLAAIRNKEGKYLSDIYQLKRTGSTASILSDKTNSHFQNIVLYGGVDYNNMVDDESSKEDIQKVVNIPLSLQRGDTNWAYLAGTLLEIEKIGNLGSESGLNVQYFTDNKATKESLYQISQYTDVLHIATHGFFYPDPIKKMVDNPEWKIEDEENVYQLNINPMLRSGLLFAGANLAEGNDRGVLTAFEASQLYFPQTSLIVLSACETGLGDSRGSEGVFGLQRAFKIAGAENLIMSLWKVSDKETAEFMDNFYGFLFETEDLEHSFHKAREAMRTKYPNNPYYWAAFILVQ